ncbi:MalY/PatB family protein [Candidatus Galacturonibacter soehngenii]|uniref:cysteine-S-conjugate beta-lyase n=1 Tax=Candidatus Galacturonatibacter soehngenii TaxID=2307010 RepID=A0A7V7UCE1_9FIRM|nr:MalY/PatB family protein [Candidatus Galacturonibacter soehngenii]KAB1439402.1 pyridoxal phosphate-dependent aminotransferase [Candidatus Galacturonibacter soehngenii]MBA4687264.1 pyridoxal phosphate-dependent aminotransferase [Candidatus Galacturonibacter soehngenii]
MQYNFDEPINRKNTYSIKYDGAAKFKKPDDLLPLWIADMDFLSPPIVSDKLKELAERGVYGYSLINQEYYQAVQNWYVNHYDWNPKQEWLLVTPGIVFAMAMAIRALTKEGEGVLIQRPVYYPFTTVIERNNRKLVNSPLRLVNGRYEIDYEDFENKIVQNNVKIFLLCNPHNPVGRVWTKEEIKKLADICLKRNVTIVSDEIHSDYVYQGHKHTVLSKLDKAYEEITITCTAPTKTFNLAGLQISNIWIPNLQIRKSIRREIVKTGYDWPSLTGIIACQAAYQGGKDWLIHVKEYLTDNLNYVKEFLTHELPEVKLIEPEGTYLIWLDFRGLLLPDEVIENLIVHKAKLWLDHGTMFGEEGKGFQRINIACPRSVLEEAMNRIKFAFKPNKINV